MFGWFKTQLEKINSPELDWIQVEVTTYCNSDCIYCPHTTMGSCWQKMHMTLELFRELIPFMRYTKLIYLQGWGEPLLNPELFEMIRMCKDNGKRVGFTTNGMLLTEETIHKLIDFKVDILGVSLAGATTASHNKFRKGNDLDEVISNLELLYRLKRERNSQRPELHLAYIMLKSNFHELEKIVPIAKRLGVTQIVASNLSLILGPELASEAIFNDTDLTDNYREILEKIKEHAGGEDILFAYNQPGLDETSIRCNENVCHSCVVNVDGEISPCVFTNPVLTAGSDRTGNRTTEHIFKDRLLPLTSISFGNIEHEKLSRIWHKKEYVGFRTAWSSGSIAELQDGLANLPESCMNCYKRLTPYL